MSAPAQRAVDTGNAEFWDELCGTTMARSLGAEAATRAALARFDAHYFAFYPYLLDHVPIAQMRGTRVLEVGLGYGSLSQRLAAAAGDYTGLDIATSPAAIVNRRLALEGLGGRALRGSILAAPFADASFDHVVAIGCFHHTGSVAAALDETWRLLRPGGVASIMVYNALSYRLWLRSPRRTWRRWREAGGGAGGRADATAERERGMYDRDSRGRAAPTTEFLSRQGLATLAARFTRCRTTLENASIPLAALRPLLCRTLGRAWGLDLYVRLEK